MNTLKLGSKDIDSIFLNTYLELPASIEFSKNTQEALIKFQTLSNLTPDGIAGPKTWESIQTAFRVNTRLTETDYLTAANYLNIQPAAIKAVKDVESGPLGAFFQTTRPTCLFEGHIFWSRLKSRGINPDQYNSPDILYPKWDKSKYQGGIKEWSRLEKAFLIHPEAALESASLGLFQIMGFNYRECSCSDVFDYYSKSFISEGSQLSLFCHFIKSRGLDKYLRVLDFSAFAKAYNGPAYKENRYDQKLQAAYNKYK